MLRTSLSYFFQTMASMIVGDNNIAAGSSDHWRLLLLFWLALIGFSLLVQVA